ncbi:translation initiation factor IF-2 [Candidatus Azobacteroides pseudotrichonymphae]|uniref:Translation initiation factor IF-2 n=1 Tax=Azobacteroides pseudotrichonymphae genomovar. CFP2 TaxID=511995 RepID=IF2_AZOPC|nr:translation initiation factor IF-2 [Candidatus Azobacteroides pseudotrichonymphae]B6YQ44.1 RecName: Full=Translation initiation factor IF-2 [Candidatus Azobacteroides pseudotrichonymphae genomovar. CFP2]BAG83316.1 translation initiation factor IF-2 [Candidatus Azobacteroides pseudotrichonymphae genomovar. CFP2]
MAIRLNKVTKLLNVGLSTIVKFLQSRGYLREENPNTKISPEEYEILNQEFHKDKHVKLDSEKLSKERFQKENYDKDKLKQIEEIKMGIPRSNEFQLLLTSKLDLDTLPQDKSQTTIEIKKTIKTSEIKEIKRENKTDILKERKQIEEIKNSYLNKQQKKSNLLSSTDSTINFTITGKIDLTTINNATRPKRKTKEEKQKEREERNKKIVNIKTEKTTQVNAGKKSIASTQTNIEILKRKKRNRIKHEKVNIEQQNISTIPNPKNKHFKFHKPTYKNEVSEEDVQKQIKETLAKLTNSSLKKGTKYRKEKRDTLLQLKNEQYKIKTQENKTIKITEFVTANDLSKMMNVPVVQVISTCMSIGIMVSINQRLDSETIDIVADEFGYKTEYVSAEAIETIIDDENENQEKELVLRPPIVTIMGHVDHGKTSLLDNIRNTNVIAGEAGGITQHIGAYNVKLDDGRKITFLDTPGHEAFTAMRARGAKITDIAIIIIASDDNIMPQTIEAINHAVAAGVPIIFAINKIDKHGANPEKIKETLASMNYLVEDWGGKYQSQDISAKKGIGIQELLEKVLLEAELLDLKANPKRYAIGSIIESSLDKGRGYIATMLIQNGTLKLGDIVLAGIYFGRVKAMFNERNLKIKEAGPSQAVLVLGLNGAPQAGDTIRVVKTEQEAREIAAKREQLQREQSLRTQKLLTLDDISRRIAVKNFHKLNIIVKGDVDGSVEALSDSLIRLSTEQIQINVIHKGVGQISESDVILATASNAFIIGFQVRPSLLTRKLAEKEGVEIRLYSIIYNAIEEVKSAMEGMLIPKTKEEITSNVEIREVYKITKVGSVAGCIVKEGKIKQGDKIRLIRNGVVIYTGELGSLKRYKDYAKEVTQGCECGLNIHNFNDIKVGDIIETFENIETKQKL